MIKKDFGTEIKRAKEISQNGNKQKAFEILMDLLDGQSTFEEEIEIVEKAYEYLTEIRAEALALREKAERFMADGKTGSAFIEAQKSLELFEKYGPKISASLAAILIAKIKQKQKEEMAEMEK